MVYIFSNKNTKLGQPRRVIQMLVYFMAIWSILRLFSIFYGYMVHYVEIWCTFRRFVTYVVSRKIWKPRL
jgi:hypothetical protein